MTLLAPIQGNNEFIPMRMLSGPTMIMLRHKLRHTYITTRSLDLADDILCCKQNTFVHIKTRPSSTRLEPRLIQARNVITMDQSRLWHPQMWKCRYMWKVAKCETKSTLNVKIDAICEKNNPKCEKNRLSKCVKCFDSKFVKIDAICANFILTLVQFAYCTANCVINDFD